MDDEPHEITLDPPPDPLDVLIRHFLSIIR